MFLKISGGNHIDVDNDLKDYIETRVSFLDKYLQDDDRVSITLSQTKRETKVVIFFVYNNKPIKVSENAEDVYYAIDGLEDTLKTLMEKRYDLKVKQEKDLENTYKFLEEFAITQEYANIQETNDTNSQDNDITKEKIIVPKPMTEKDAEIEMRKMGYDTYIFVNSNKNNAYCSLYTRNDGSLGLLIMSDEE